MEPIAARIKIGTLCDEVECYGIGKRNLPWGLVSEHGWVEICAVRYEELDSLKITPLAGHNKWRPGESIHGVYEGSGF